MPAEALYGISTVRAMENFPLARRSVNCALVHAYGAVKLACARTNNELGLARFRQSAIRNPQSEIRNSSGLFRNDGRHARRACGRGCAPGRGGTSTNMNVNEVLANRALQLLGRPLGRLRHGQPAGRRQPAPVHQRHLPDGPERRCDHAVADVGARSRRPAGGVPAKGEGIRRASSRSAARRCRTPCLSRWGAR